MRLGSLVLILTGAVILGIGAIVGVIGGVGELAYYQCVENGSAPCTTTGSNQYVTVFLANNDLLTIGMNVLLVGGSHPSSWNRDTVHADSQPSVWYGT
jgi:hypothetical protein